MCWHSLQTTTLFKSPIEGPWMIEEKIVLHAYNCVKTLTKFQAQKHLEKFLQSYNFLSV